MYQHRDYIPYPGDIGIKEGCVKQEIESKNTQNNIKLIGQNEVQSKRGWLNPLNECWRNDTLQFTAFNGRVLDMCLSFKWYVGKCSQCNSCGLQSKMLATKSMSITIET